MSRPLLGLSHRRFCVRIIQFLTASFSCSARSDSHHRVAARCCASRVRHMIAAVHELHYPLHWKVAMMIVSGQSHEIFHGRTQDISLGGTCVHCDHRFEHPHDQAMIILLAATPTSGIETFRITLKGKLLQVSTPVNGVGSILRIQFQDCDAASLQHLASILHRCGVASQ